MPAMGVTVMRTRTTATVVTVSDGVTAGSREDTAGPAVAAMLTEAGFDVARALVVATGGTGLGPRDVTPEATLDVIEREVPGLAEAMRTVGRASTPRADLSRAVCGTRGRTLIVDLPGSPRGATESLAAILDLLPHAADLLAGDTAHG